MTWLLVLAIFIFFCFVLSKIEDYSHFDFNEEAIFIGKRKIVEIKYNTINTIDRSPFGADEFNGISYFKYYFYYIDEKGNEVKFSFKRASTFRDLKKWNKFKEKLLQVNPSVIINEFLL